MHRFNSIGKGGPRHRTTEEELSAFFGFVKIGSWDECWMWVVAGPSGKDNYGYVTFCGKTWRAHRASWAIFYGAIPVGRHVLHKCDNKECVNPNHLFLGTHADNMRDMAEKGRSRRNRKLTDKDVLTIRQRLAQGEVQRRLALEYGISTSVMNRLAHGKIWRNYLLPHTLNVSLPAALQP